jgi:hypothetical protein
MHLDADDDVPTRPARVGYRLIDKMKTSCEMRRQRA